MNDQCQKWKDSSNAEIVKGFHFMEKFTFLSKVCFAGFPSRNFFSGIELLSQWFQCYHGLRLVLQLEITLEMTPLAKTPLILSATVYMKYDHEAVFVRWTELTIDIKWCFVWSYIFSISPGFRITDDKQFDNDNEAFANESEDLNAYLKTYECRQLHSFVSGKSRNEVPTEYGFVRHLVKAVTKVNEVVRVQEVREDATEKEPIANDNANSKSRFSQHITMFHISIWFSL